MQIPSIVKEIIESNINRKFTPMLLAAPAMLQSLKELIILSGYDQKADIDSIAGKEGIEVFERAVKLVKRIETETLNNQLDRDTLLEFTRVKNGHATGKTYTNTAGVWIDAVREENTNCSIFPQLIGVGEPDEGGEFADYKDPFHYLSVKEQLDLCIEADDSSYASYTTYRILEE